MRFEPSHLTRFVSLAQNMTYVLCILFGTKGLTITGLMNKVKVDLEYSSRSPQPQRENHGKTLQFPKQLTMGAKKY
jgi:hypothetical protein